MSQFACCIVRLEMPKTRWKYKSRICNPRDSFFDAQGRQVLFEETATSAISLADGIEVFLQTDLAQAGEPDT